MNLTKFYSDSQRLSYNPAKLTQRRSGIKAFISFDDRFITVSRFLEKEINKAKGRLKILDVGVGDGVYEGMLSKDALTKADFYGVDISRNQLERAGKYLKEAKVVDFDKGNLPYKDNFFDIIIASEIFEHLFYPEKLAKEVYRLTKRNGLMILTYPNSGALQIRMSMFFTGSSPLINYSRNKEHIRFFNKKDITAMFPEAYKEKFQGLVSLFFDKWNFPVKIYTPRILQIAVNNILPNLSLGHLLVLRK